MSEPTDQILSAIAHEMTGLVAANCCAKTGGRGGPAASKHCECRETALDVYRAAAPLIESAVLEEAAKALAPFARAADVYHEERFAPDDEITGRFGKIVRAEELWCLRNLYTRLRARGSRALKPASPSPSADSA